MNRWHFSTASLVEWRMVGVISLLRSSSPAIRGLERFYRLINSESIRAYTSNVKHALMPGFLLIASLAHTQTSTTIPSVDVCQLTQHPGLYIGKQVAVRGRVTQAFEDFSVHDEQCPSFQNRVVLTYGDMKENLKYWKHFFHVELPDTTFLHDREAKHFNDLLRAFRVFAPNGDECGPERCSFFRISATLTGRFIAIKTANASYIGSCCVLIIERVSGVNATRTEVPFGGVYRCEEQGWSPTAIERAALTSSDSQQTLSRDPRAARLRMFSQIAQHWHDPDIANGNLEITTGGWTSPDLLRRYTILGTGERMIVTRQVCHASADVPPKEISPDFACTHSYWQPSSPAEASLQPDPEPQLASAARNAIAAATASWHTQLPDLLVNTCKHKNDGNFDYGQYSFTTQDGAVSVRVELLRMQKRNKHAQYLWTVIPWTSRVRGAFCSQ